MMTMVQMEITSVSSDARKNGGILSLMHANMFIYYIYHTIIFHYGTQGSAQLLTLSDTVLI